MRVFLDTNVLVSAFATRGLSADVVRVVLNEHELCTSEDVLIELRRVLVEKFSVPVVTIEEILSLLHMCHVERSPDKFVPVGLRDETDEIILAAAIESEADVLVTGDRDLLAVARKIKRESIVSPRSFWEIIGDRMRR